MNHCSPFFTVFDCGPNTAAPKLPGIKRRLLAAQRSGNRRCQQHQRHFPLTNQQINGLPSSGPLNGWTIENFALNGLRMACEWLVNGLWMTEIHQFPQKILQSHQVSRWRSPCTLRQGHQVYLAQLPVHCELGSSEHRSLDGSSVVNYRVDGWLMVHGGWFMVNDDEMMLKIVNRFFEPVWHSPAARFPADGFNWRLNDGCNRCGEMLVTIDLDGRWLMMVDLYMGLLQLINWW